MYLLCPIHRGTCAPLYIQSRPCMCAFMLLRNHAFAIVATALRKQVGHQGCKCIPPHITAHHPLSLAPRLPARFFSRLHCNGRGSHRSFSKSYFLLSESLGLHVLVRWALRILSLLQVCPVTCKRCDLPKKRPRVTTSACVRARLSEVWVIASGGRVSEWVSETVSPRWVVTS